MYCCYFSNGFNLIHKVQILIWFDQMLITLKIFLLQYQFYIDMKQIIKELALFCLTP